MMEDDKNKENLENENNTPETPEGSTLRRDSSSEEEQKVLFPEKKESESEKKTASPTPGFRWPNLMTLIVLLVGFYVIGFLTNPEQLQNTSQTLKDIAYFSKERLQPVKEKIVAYIEDQMERPDGTQEARRSEGSGTTVQGQPMPQMTNEMKGRKIKYWQAPMNPDYKRDKPGKSPMGMALIPVYENEADDSGEININPTVVQNIGVKTAKVQRRKLTHQIRTTGIITYDERKIHHVHTKYGGWIEKLYVDFKGQFVKKGDIVMDIYSPKLVSTQEEFLLALKYKESLENSPIPEIRRGAETLLKTTRRRLELFDVPNHQIEELKKDRLIKKAMHIHSHTSGFVIKKNVDHGEYIEATKPLYMIADLSNIWVMADIYEHELPWVKIGQKAEMNLSYFPGKTFKGEVTYIDPYLDPKSRTLKVRMEFKNPDGALKPDMYANVFLKSTVAKNGVAVPEQAIIRSGENDLVVVQTGAGQFESRKIVLGAQAEDYYQVLEGLRPGETVVTSSSFLIDSESRLTEALNKFNASRDGTKKKNEMKMESDNKGQQPGKLELQLDEKSTDQ
ncbi:efflux RND transporter periplasmic adaptor subunit [Nitrospina watsonii]|uniref:Cation efflux system transmembrane protein (Modular protein) n=1 Tax=Nitrospina watsonii TaxID=1323948 RepID=A0ABM9HDH6_9BACT|nr:efflux RND transporter periplasmic adaptor subunit [Nitrospina watsonii]CAI2718283.1 Putative cation efflux system transmembrane protein (Modular protein) [Nitrospina watsonii]